MGSTPWRDGTSYYKPKAMKKYLTMGEVADLVDKDKSWIRKLERAGRLPKAHRVQHGALSVRLWSPTQVKEIVKIIANMKVGRPSK